MLSISFGKKVSQTCFRFTRSTFSPLCKFSTNASVNIGSIDDYYETHRISKRPDESNRRDFTYFFLSHSRMAEVGTGRYALFLFLGSLSPASNVLALASAEFDVSSVPVGNTITVKWRGKPIFIKHLTQDEVIKEDTVDVTSLRHPETSKSRSEKPEWVVVIGVCTHLGCVPISNAGDFGGWFCPCHGSHYDMSGRIRKGPAPLNLELPPYKFLDDSRILIG